MTDVKPEKIDYRALRQALYGELLSDKTEKAARNLLIVATATLLVSVFEVSFKPTPLFPFDFTKAPNALAMFLSAANIVLLSAFLVRLLPDILRAREEWAFAAKIIEQERIERAHAAAKAVEDQISANDPNGPDYGFDPEDWWQNFIDAREEGLAQMDRLQKRIEDRRISIGVRHVRLLTLCAFPVLVGGAAFWHTASAAWRFVQAVVGV
jgi:hypothetical protein